MSFSDYKKRLFEAKELASIDSYDEYVQKALPIVLKNEIEPLAIDWYNESWSKGHAERKAMEEYKAKGSNPIRLANSTKDLLKVVSRLIWCRANWPEAVESYTLRAYEIMNEEDKWQFYIKAEINKIKREEEKQRKFEEEVSNTDTDKFAPTERDWQKMIDYLNKKSNPQRLANSCKDANKIIARFIIAKALHWDECAKEFKYRAKLLNIATDAELEAYARKYADCNVPADWQEYIDALKQDNVKGGLAKQDEEYTVDSRISKILDEDIDVADYSVYKIDNFPYSTCVRIVRYDMPDLYIVYKFNVYYREHNYGWRGHRGRQVKYYGCYLSLTEDPNTQKMQEKLKNEINYTSRWGCAETQNGFAEGIKRLIKIDK